VEVAAQRGPEPATAILAAAPAAMDPELPASAIIAIVEGTRIPAAAVIDLAVIERQVIEIVRAAIDRIAIAIIRPVIVVVRVAVGVIALVIAVIGLIVGSITLIIGRLVIVAVAAAIVVIGLRACRKGQRAQATKGDDGRLDEVFHFRFTPYRRSRLRFTREGCGQNDGAALNPT